MRIASTLKHQVTLPIGAPSLFEWFGREGSFLRLSPPWIRITLLSKDSGLESGNRTIFHVKIGPFTTKWVMEHVDYEHNLFYTDMQITGPFVYWHHVHKFRRLDAKSCILEDTVLYIPPLGPITQFFFRRSIKRMIKQMFRYRSRILFNDITCITKYKSDKKRILIAGGSGFIGSELTAFLQACGHTVSLLTRTPKQENEIGWDVTQGVLDANSIEGFDVVINLAGENIGSGRWTEKKKQSIRNSRIDATRLLVQTINSLKNKPSVFVSASAIGYFGIATTEPLNESASRGDSFLAQVCAEWEQEAQQANCRVVNPRFGLVLSPKGGALQKMLRPFKFGVGGTLGNGNQLISWITIDDLLYQMYHVIMTPTIEGPVNFVTNNTITNKLFTKHLSRALNRPMFCNVPRWILMLFLGHMGKETLLASTAAKPQKLIEEGATFAYPTLKKALEHLLPR